MTLVVFLASLPSFSRNETEKSFVNYHALKDGDSLGNELKYERQLAGLVNHEDRISCICIESRVHTKPYISSRILFRSEAD